MSMARVMMAVGVAGMVGMGLGLGGCAQSRGRAPVAVAPASEATSAALLGRIKTLEGTWVGVSPDGQAGTTEFRVSSAGHVVREVMFPGAPHEMTNTYHMDGESCVVTHYCAVGNQPRMRARLNDGHAHASDEIHFHFDSLTNYTKAQDHYMGELAIKFVSPNEFHQIWTSTDKGVKAEPMTFVWKRK